MSTNKSRLLKSLAFQSNPSRSARQPRTAPSTAGQPARAPRAAAAPPTQVRERVTLPVRVYKPHVVWEDSRQLVLNKPAGAAIQGQHGSTARRVWDQVLNGEFLRRGGGSGCQATTNVSTHSSPRVDTALLSEDED